MEPDDYDDGLATCEKCGGWLTADEDGDGIMTAPVYFCENCNDEDSTLPAEQPREGGG